MSMKSKFKIRKEDGDIVVCESCGCEVPTIKDLGDGNFYCDLCYSTFIANGGPVLTPTMLAQAIHWLLKEIKK